MASLIRTILYALVILAGLRLAVSGPIAWPTTYGVLEVFGAAVTLAGVAVTLWCVVVFAFIGRGTPLPFDPPRRFVVSGPYRFVRNPMALGVAVMLLGISMVFRSGGMVVVTMVFIGVIHALVTLYEEPTLRESFGADYVAYCASVNRWVPRWPKARGNSDHT